MPLLEKQTEDIEHKLKINIKKTIMKKSNLKLGKIPITVNNFTEVMTGNAVKTLPETLQKLYPSVKNKLQFYDDSEKIKAYIDAYISKLNQMAGKSAPMKKETRATGKKQKAKARTMAKKQSPAKKAAAPKKQVKTVPKVAAKPSATEVAKVSPEVRFIKRYVLMDGKRKTRKQLLAFINSLQRAIEKKEIRKISRYASEIEHIQKELLKIYNDSGVGNTFTFHLDDSDKKVIEKYRAIAGSEKQRTSVRLISRYIGIHGQTSVKEKAARLLKAIKTAFKNKKVPDTDPYYKELKKVEGNLNEFLKAKEARLEINKVDLKGLQGIAGTNLGLIKHNHPVKKGDKVLTPFGERGTVEKVSKDGVAYISEFPGQSFKREFLKLQTAEKKEHHTPNRRKKMQYHGNFAGSITAKQLAGIDYETFGFTGKWKSLIGDPAKPFKLMFWSKPGLGKSSLAIELAKYLAAKFHQKVLFVAAEEGLSYTLKEKFTRLNALDDNIHIVPELPSDLSPYDVIVLDSITDMEMTPEDFTKMKRKYPEKSFILVFQATSSGDYRGNKKWEHAVDVSIYINDNGYAKVSKGRFGGDGTLKVFSGNIDPVYKFTLLQDAEKFVANRKDEKLRMVQGDDGKVWVTNTDKAMKLKAQGYELY